jgi:hypothetical protein
VGLGQVAVDEVEVGLAGGEEADRLMLPPFGGHLKLLKQGVHHAEIETTLPGGIPPANY